MRLLPIPPLMFGLLALAACDDARRSDPPALTRPLLSVANPTENLDEELIGTGLYGTTDADLYQLTALGNKPRYLVDLGEGSASMYYVSWGKNRWGYFTDKSNNCAPSSSEQHDSNGDNLRDGGPEKHCISNGEYLVRLHRVQWDPSGLGHVPGSDTVLFERRVAMLDTLGSPENIPTSGFWQDVRVAFSLSRYPTHVTGSIRAADFFHDFTVASDTALYSPPGTSFTLGVGDTLWFASTHLAQPDTGPACAWCGQHSGVLVHFHWDYAQSPGVRSFSTNSVPETGAHMPMLHLYSTPRPGQPYQAVARITEPYHYSNDSGRIQTGQNILATVMGLDACFTRSGLQIAGSPITFDGRCSQAYGVREYRWDFGDQTPATTWSAGDSTLQHTYAQLGTYIVRLDVRRATSTAPTDSSLQAITVSGLTVTLVGPDLIGSSGTYQWHAVATGGVTPYHDQWYYKQGVTEQQVGTDSPDYRRDVSVGKTSYTFRLRTVVTDAVPSAREGRLFVEVIPGGGNYASVGALTASGMCAPLPAVHSQRQAALSAIAAAGRWPVPCLLGR